MRALVSVEWSHLTARKVPGIEDSGNTLGTRGGYPSGLQLLDNKPSLSKDGSGLGCLFRRFSEIHA